MNARQVSLSLVVSLAVHVVVFGSLRPIESTATYVKSSAPTKSTALEQSANTAFEELDNARIIDAAREEILSNIPIINISKQIEALSFKPEPKPKPKTQPGNKKAVNSAPAPSARAKTATSGGQPTNQNASNANRKQAKEDYGQIVRAIISQNMRLPNALPRRAKGAKVVVTVQFVNGQHTASGLVQSSGFSEIDQAALTALRQARFPKPNAELPNNVIYNFPLKIN